MADILLTTINAKWIHPSLALRLLKANLGPFEARCEILEFALRQSLAEKTEGILAARPQVLGVSVSIWNHLATIELLKELEKMWGSEKPVVVLGGPEVSHLPQDAEIFALADYVIRGEGETAFGTLCEKIFDEKHHADGRRDTAMFQDRRVQFIDAENVDVGQIKSAYHLYTGEDWTDMSKKLIYVESSRGCPFSCEFCLSSVRSAEGEKNVLREFPLEPFLDQMDELVLRGVKTFKFLDRTFNINIKRALRIMEFFLKKIEERKGNLVVHFEMVPSLFPCELREMLSRFPPGTLRIEVGIQTLNAEVASRIGRPVWRSQTVKTEEELEIVRFLREKTNAIIHADLIAGLPGEDLVSFGKGFDRLWLALSETERKPAETHSEIQLGILKLLPGVPISRHNDSFGMRYNSLPPYEIEETSAMSARDIRRIKNFARFWEIIINRKNFSPCISNCQKDSTTLYEVFSNEPVFEKFMILSDLLFAHFGRNWGIDKNELRAAVQKFIFSNAILEPTTVMKKDLDA